MASSLVFEKIFDPSGDTTPAVELDTTLTVAGKAADAKAAGDAIDEVRGELEGLPENMLQAQNDIKTINNELTKLGGYVDEVVTQFEETEQKAETNRTNISSLDSRVTELETSTSNRPCLLNNANTWEEVVDAFNYYLSTSAAIIFTHGEDNCNLLSYEYSGNALSALYFIASSGKKLIKVTTEDGADLVVTENDIVDSDGTTIELDTTLTESGKAADAKVVGDRLNTLIEPYSKGLAYTLKADGTYEVSGIGTCKDTDIIIPPVVDGYRVTSICHDAFNRCTSLTSLVISNGVTSIGYSAFQSCTNLKTAYIPNSVTEIDGSIFMYCSTLTNVTISTNIEKIPHYMFFGCYKLSQFAIPSSVNSIGASAFGNCFSLTTIELPSHIETIMTDAFYGCNSLMIYCEAESKPDNWVEGWNPNNRPVFWGVALNFLSVNNRTADKITYIDTWSNIVRGVSVGESGITWEDEFGLEINRNEFVNGGIYQKIPIAAGNNVTFKVFEVDGEQVVKINADVQSMISVTYAELKALRDTAKLIPGMFYRITDYVCTTIQPDTRAMENKFDIIVQALSNNTLSENAKADYHAEGGVFKPEFLADEDGMLVGGAVTKYYDIYEDTDDMGNGTLDYKSSDIFVEYGYLENNEGVTVPVLYKSDLDAYPGLGADYNDIFYYVGTYELNGTIYDRWRKIESADDGKYRWDSTGKIYVLTNVIVEGGSAKSGYFKNANLPAWELKYCLDNDNTRFAWAIEGQVIIALGSFSPEEPLTRQPEFDGECEYEEYRYAWGTQAYVDEGDATKFWYSMNEVLTDGEHLYNGGGTRAAQLAEQGKGVIYYMKDEHGNECPYDFKNIQFKRTIYFGNGYPKLDEENGTETWIYTFCCYNGSGALVDGSTEIYYGRQNDETFDSFHHNIIGVYFDSAITGKSAPLKLNDNVFLGTVDYGSDYFFANCSYNTLKANCYGNTFGVGSSNNTFGYNCSENTFGDGCSDNIFGENCVRNILGSSCWNNIFETSCRGIKIQIDGVTKIHICKGVLNQTLTPEPNASYEQIYRMSGSREILI